MTATVRPLNQRSSNAPSTGDSRVTSLAGGLLLVAGTTVLMGIITAEALYPAAYNTHTQTVSDLAAMRPENLVRQPSAAIFNGTMIVAGLAIAMAAYLLHCVGNRRRTTIPVALLGLGMVGVGFFPGNHLAPHQIFAMTAFVAGGVGAILTATLHRRALRMFHTGLGIIALTALVVGVFLLSWSPVVRLGEGGVERWVVYPVVLWVITLGAALANTSTETIQTRRCAAPPGTEGRQVAPGAITDSRSSMRHSDAPVETSTIADANESDC
jgi:hypothetical membrane protein